MSVELVMEQKHELMDFWSKYFDFSDRELKAFKDIDRSQFIPKEVKDMAYQDSPLPLLRGKTISQPTTVMIMTAALELEPGMKVFEVGTGSGYQAAIIANIVGKKGKVVTTEVIPELVHFAKANLKKANINNIKILEADGSQGYKKGSPYDRIILTCASKEFPQPLIDQLKVGGMIVGPVGSVDEQEMVKGIKQKEGKLQMEFLGQFLFTPMYGKYGFEV